MYDSFDDQETWEADRDRPHEEPQPPTLFKMKIFYDDPFRGRIQERDIEDVMSVTMDPNSVVLQVTYLVNGQDLHVAVWQTRDVRHYNLKPMKSALH